MAMVPMYRWPGYVVEDRGYETACWIWQRCGSQGYGQIITWRGRVERPHVVWWRMACGTIPPGLTLDHLCRNRACCNPAHLEAVTNAENSRRGSKAKITQPIADEIRRRRAAGETNPELGREFGIAACTVSNIVAGRNWA